MTNASSDVPTIPQRRDPEKPRAPLPPEDDAEVTPPVIVEPPGPIHPVPNKENVIVRLIDFIKHLGTPS